VYKIPPPEINITKSWVRVQAGEALLILELEKFPTRELAAGFFNLVGRDACILTNFCYARLPIAEFKHPEFLLGNHPKPDRHRRDRARLFRNHARSGLRALQGDVLDEFGSADVELFVEKERYAVRGISVNVDMFYGEACYILKKRVWDFHYQVFSTDLAQSSDFPNITLCIGAQEMMPS